MNIQTFRGFNSGTSHLNLARSVKNKIKRISKIILFKNDKFLLHLRDNNKGILYPNTWSLIGGELENEESAENGIKREVMEELCLDLERVSHFSTRIKRELGMPLEENIFYAELPVEIRKLHLREGKEIRMFSIDEINSLNNIRPVFRNAILEFKDKMWGQYGC